MRNILSFAAALLLLVAGHVGAVAQETVTLSKVGPAITNLDQIVHGKQYVIWIKAAPGPNRQGLVYTRSHECAAKDENGENINNTNYRISGNGDTAMPTAGTNVDVSVIFTVERDNDTDGNPRFAFKTCNDKYIDSQDHGINYQNGQGGDPIHESTERGLFYITKIGGGVTIGDGEADTWFLKSATEEKSDGATSDRLFVNTGGYDTGGLVLYKNKTNGQDDGYSKVCILPVETTVTLQSVGAPIKSIEEIVDGGQYMIWVVSNSGDGRHGLVYTKFHNNDKNEKCDAQGIKNTNYRVTAHNNDYNTMPAAGVTVEGTSIFTIEVYNTDGGEPRFAFKAADGKYIDSQDRGAKSGGDPIHESEDTGLFYITKTGSNKNITDEANADIWYLKSATEEGNRVYVNTGGADTGGLVLYENQNGGDDDNSRVKIIPVGKDVTLTSTSNLDNAATFSHKYDFNVVAPNNVKVYKIAEAGENEARLSEISSRVIPAETGVILVGETETAKLAATTKEVGEEDYEGNLLVGLPDGGMPDLTNGGTAYVFTRDGNAAVFKPYLTGSSFEAGKACLVLSEAAGASVLAIRLGGTTTGIDRATDKTENNTPKYDLSGRRVTSVARGSLYIQGGKKYIAR